MSGELPAVTWPSGAVVSPSGCGSCGIPLLEHADHWSGSSDWHPWTEPTRRQRRERMLARRAARTKS